MKLFAATLLVLPFIAPIQAQTVQNFEAFSDSTVLTNQISGLTFANATVLTSGISLNEAQFPPHSGVNAVSNPTSSSITITLATPVANVLGYFTYSGSLTIQAFNSSNVLVATSNSLFSNNTKLSGVGGSSPNEPIQVSSAGGIASIVITSAGGASSFVLDDLTINANFSVPTLSARAIGALGLFVALLACLMLNRQTRAAGMVAVFLLFTVSGPRHASATVSIITQSTPSPQGFPLNTPTMVTFSCTVAPGSAGIANTVTLVRTDTTPATLIGPMILQSGTTYSLTVSVTVTSSSRTQQYQCTVGNGTVTVRAKSQIFTVGGLT